MPSININLVDNTGAEYIGDEQVVFVPGELPIRDKYQDDNNCCYIPASDEYKLTAADDGYLNMESIQKDLAEAEEALITAKNNLSEVKKSCEQDPPAASEADLKAAEKAVEKCSKDLTDIQKKSLEAETTAALVRAYLQLNYDVIYFNSDPTKWNENSLTFLYDKDSYNVKFLTAGRHYPITAKYSHTEKTDKNEAEKRLAISYSLYNLLTQVAIERKDCMVLASVGYNAEEIKGVMTGDQFADCIFKSLNPKVGEVIVATNPVVQTDTLGRKFSELLLPNVRIPVGDATVTVPASYAYLAALSEAMNRDQDWSPIANSARGSVTAIPDLKMTKYHFDKVIIKDIVEIKPYGNVIWGDRTLLLNGKGVSASSYTSLMLMVCDISKRAYQASVRYTYESNNSVTWLNYKSMITPLLDQMVSSGVLQSYDIKKINANSNNFTSPYNTMICKITVYPNLPVENFDIYINLENADLTLEND